MQHVEEAGVHSGDSACVLPPHSLGEEMLEQIRDATREIALAIGVVGLINVQYAIHGEAALRHRGQPAGLAHGAVRLQGCRRCRSPSSPAGSCSARASPSSGCRAARRESATASTSRVKEAVLPFDRFDGADALLGPGDALDRRGDGHRARLPDARSPRPRPPPASPLPTSGTVFISVTDGDKAGAFAIAQILHDCGFRIVATRGTAQAIARMGIPVEPLNKIGEGSPHVVDWIERGDVDLLVNTPTGVGARSDGWEIRRAAVAHGVPA